MGENEVSLSMPLRRRVIHQFDYHKQWVRSIAHNFVENWQHRAGMGYLCKLEEGCEGWNERMRTFSPLEGQKWEK